MRTIYFTIGFSSIKLYLTPTEASYNVSPFSFQGEIPLALFFFKETRIMTFSFLSFFWTRYTKINFFKEKRNGF